MTHDNAEHGDIGHVDSAMKIVAACSAVLVIDMQDRILQALPDRPTVVWNTRRLLDGAALFEVPVAATEQSPEKLGASAMSLQPLMPPPVAKTRFSAGHACPLATWAEQGRRQILVAGIETHICVLQTCLDLLAESLQVCVVADAVGARGVMDHQIALRSLEAQGAQLTTTESVLFQWCADATHDHFRSVSALVREAPPDLTT